MSEETKQKISMKLKGHEGVAGVRRKRTFEEKNKAREVSPPKKQIVAIGNNEQFVFESVKYASQQLNISRASLINHLNNGKQHSIGYSFKYCN